MTFQASRLGVARLWGALDASDRRPGRGILVAILAGAFLPRLGLAWETPTIHSPTRYQVAEQASRAAHGYGIVSWSSEPSSRRDAAGAGRADLSRAPPPTAERLIQAALFSALSLIPVWVAFRWADRLQGLPSGVLCAVMMATWFELVYFGPKPLPDVVCSYGLPPAFYLARPGARAVDPVLAGASLMLALAVRVQIAPAVGGRLAPGTPRRRPGGRKGRPDWSCAGRAALAPARIPALLAGSAIGLAIAGAMEWMWWGVPFLGQIGYLKMEFVHHASSYFSREPITFFLKQYILIYGPALPVVGFLVWSGARHAPVVAIAGLALVVPFHLIGHKEYRFLVVAAPMIVLLMGLAAAEIVRRFALWGRPAALTWLAAGWIVAMLAICFGDYYRALWTRFTNHVLAFE